MNQLLQAVPVFLLLLATGYSQDAEKEVAAHLLPCRAVNSLGQTMDLIACPDGFQCDSPEVVALENKFTFCKNSTDDCVPYTHLTSVNTELDDPSKTCSEMKCKNKKKKGGKKGNNKGRKKGGKKEGKKNKAKAAKRRNKKNGGAARVV